MWLLPSRSPRKWGTSREPVPGSPRALTRVCPAGSELSRVGEGGCPCRSLKQGQAVAQWIRVGGRGS